MEKHAKINTIALLYIKDFVTEIKKKPNMGQSHF